MFVGVEVPFIFQIRGTLAVTSIQGGTWLCTSPFLSSDCCFLSDVKTTMHTIAYICYCWMEPNEQRSLNMLYVKTFN